MMVCWVGKCSGSAAQIPSPSPKLLLPISSSLCSWTESCQFSSGWVREVSTPVWEWISCLWSLKLDIIWSACSALQGSTETSCLSRSELSSKPLSFRCYPPVDKCSCKRLYLTSSGPAYHHQRDKIGPSVCFFFQRGGGIQSGKVVGENII